jgi:hypothetical protein
MPASILTTDILPTGILTTGILLTGILTTGILLTGILTTGILPTGILTTGILPTAIRLPFGKQHSHAASFDRQVSSFRVDQMSVGKNVFDQKTWNQKKKKKNE